MPTKKITEKVRKMKREGKSVQAQAGEFVREEIHTIRKGKHGARSTKQAIAIALSEARRAGVDLRPPKKGKYSEETREKAIHDLEVGDKPRHKPSRKRSQAATKALKRESKTVASGAALSRHAKAVANRRTASERSAIAKKAVAARSPEERSASAKKAAATRARTAKENARE